MSTLLITVALGNRRRDLAVRADVPIADLLAPLGEVVAPTVRRSAGTAAGTALGTRQALGLAPLCGEALPAGRSLEECGIGHGAVLVLIGGAAERGLPPLLIPRGPAVAEADANPQARGINPVAETGSWCYRAPC